MRRLSYIVLTAGLTAWYWHSEGAKTASVSTTQYLALSTPETQTQAVVAATTAFLASLDADQRKQVVFPFTPQKTATVATFRRAGMGGFVGEQYSLPENANIHVIDQTRNVNRSVYQLTFAVEGTAPIRSFTALLPNQPLAQSWADTRSAVKTYFVDGIEHMLNGYCYSSVRWCWLPSLFGS